LVQDKLREKGFDIAGQVDGVWGESTTAAVKRFQAANNLAQTGQLDTSLIGALGIGSVLEGETSTKFLDGLLTSARDKSSTGYGAPLFVSPAHVAQIQHVLSERGFYKGEVDGVWGEGTAAAANRYRAAMGLEADDGIDVALLHTLNHQRVEVPKLSTQVTAYTTGVPLRAGPTTLRAMQRALSANGHDAGAVDGIWGANTRDALRSFQREHELESTGTLTLPTLAALGIDVKRSDGFGSRAQTEAAPAQTPASVADDR
jgi:peptidoglycan hydrolase-like protein with peptidoglycan-binding domain